ncbi:hypothetical protein GCM10010201_35200 [Pilimelia columellifera subsp. columellifera]|uniref:Uncharacterized protein n=1 Tax=Pilimelia columellifera subsp. columellifera TaxID=706583 RepID=A0ABN3NTA6_9ACTN
MHVDLDTLATALYVRIDDELKASPQLNRWRPAVGITPRITDAELITVSVMQALLGYHNESRWIRYARGPIIHLFPGLPKQPGAHPGAVVLCHALEGHEVRQVPRQSSSRRAR